jgi:hypothetical protein
MKLLIITPFYEGKLYCFKEFMDNLYGLSYQNWDHLVIDNTADESFHKRLAEEYKDYNKTQFMYARRGKTTREALARAQRLGRDICLKGDYTHMLSLECDIFPHKDAIQRLAFNMKRVVTGVYLIGTEDTFRIPCITVFTTCEETGVLGTRLVGVKPHPEVPGKKYIDYDEVKEMLEPGLKRVAAGGMGCCLIHRSVLEKIPFMYEAGLDGHSDIYFFNQCFREDIDVYVDTRVICRHDNSDWRLVKDR